MKSLTQLVHFPNGSECLSEVMRLISKPHGAQRIDFLRLACRLAGPTRCAVLLWLFDPDQETKHDLVLDRYYYAPDDGLWPSELLLRRTAGLDPTTPGVPLSASSTASWGISLADQPQIKRWCAEKGFGDHVQEYACPFFAEPTTGQRDGLMGVLHVLSVPGVPEPLTSLLNSLADALGGMILRDRQERQLGALLTLLPLTNLDQSVESLLTRAAESLRTYIKAEVCFVYRQQRNLALKAIATSSNRPHERLDKLVTTKQSLYYRVLRMNNPVRVREFKDVKERQNKFGTQEYDENLLNEESKSLKDGKLRSLLAAPVLITDEGAAVIVLINKTHQKGGFHLTKWFSRTDQDVLQAVCKLLAAVLPSTEVYRAMGRMSEVVYTGALKQSDKRQAVFNELANLIPGVECATLGWQHPQPGIREPIHLGGSSWFNDSNLPTRSTPNAVALPDGPAGEKRFQFTHPIPYLDSQNPRLLVVGLRRGPLSPYEQQLIHFMCQDLSQALRGDEDLDRELADLVQIRHIIRSNLTGAIGWCDSARHGYEIYKKLGYARWYLDERDFGEGLKWADFFCAKLQGLMEESRFLLSDITREKLRPGEHSISALVRQVVKCLEPFATLRRLTVRLLDRIPEGDDSVRIDFQLMDILVFNIIENALKYSHRGRIVTVELFLDREDWKLRVTNFGVRIEEKDREAIYLRFQRRPTGDDATTRPGTGLGLAVAKEIAKAHNGEIDHASDEIAEGTTCVAKTTFFVRLPRRLT